MPEAAVARSGLGFDVHRFASGRDLWLAGVRFDGEDGLMGHSDGDAVCHAVGDALLGASALGDVGEHFPDTDAAYEGISGSELLGRVVALVVEGGFTPWSCDVTVVCDRPAISPRRGEMRARLGEILSIGIDRISVKATRPEGLGLAGDGIGCLAIAVVT
jgi:2-C-methyl-D-erythritol 4-phosphate cytidylyltransferase/2-C-methyl-D-erythritol 2,4-cyclodiphosphate synthase